MRISRSASAAQFGSSSMGSSAGVNAPYRLVSTKMRDEDECGDEEESARPPSLQGDRLPFRSQGAKLGDEVAAVSLDDHAQLRRTGDSSGGGERLGDLVGREVRQCPLVHTLGVRPHGEHQHHVGEVHRLPPWRWPDLDEGDVDQVEVAVLDEEVGRLDVAMGDAGPPELLDHREPLVDDLVVDVGVSDLDGSVEELGDHHVFPFGGELDDADRFGRPDPGVHEDPRRVVLVLDHPGHGLERPLVLEPAVQDRAAVLVPAVGSDVVHRIQLPEQEGVGIAGDAETKRCRATRRRRGRPASPRAP